MFHNCKGVFTKTLVPTKIILHPSCGNKRKIFYIKSLPQNMNPKPQNSQKLINTLNRSFINQSAAKISMKCYFGNKQKNEFRWTHEPNSIAADIQTHVHRWQMVPINSRLLKTKGTFRLIKPTFKDTSFLGHLESIHPKKFCLQCNKCQKIPCLVQTRTHQIRGSLNKFPEFFRMGTFINSTHMKL